MIPHCASPRVTLLRPISLQLIQDDSSQCISQVIFVTGEISFQLIQDDFSHCISPCNTCYRSLLPPNSRQSLTMLSPCNTCMPFAPRLLSIPNMFLSCLHISYNCSCRMCNCIITLCQMPTENFFNV